MHCLENGLYELRYIPKAMHPPFPIGGMYATATDLGGPIMGEALGPHATGTQRWQVNKVDGQKDTFVITGPQWPQTPYHLGPGPILPGWGVTGNPGRHEHVTYKLPLSQWRIQKDKEGKDVYDISPVVVPTGIVGVGYFVDLDNRNESLFINTFPITFPEPPRGRWEFIKLSQN